MKNLLFLPIVLLPLLCRAQVIDITSAPYNATTASADNAAAIQAAITAAAAGDTVLVPAGTFLSGPITLKSNLNFQVAAGAVLRMTAFGTFPQNTNFIYGKNLANISITGAGIIDGQGKAWWDDFNAGNPDNRPPAMIYLSGCKSVTLTGVAVQDSPKFHIQLLGAMAQVYASGLSITAAWPSPNTDGIDLRGSNYLIENCYISGGDDVIQVGGSDAVSNVTIRNCSFGTGHGLSIGGYTQGGVKNLLVDNCVFNGTQYGIRWKTGRDRGGIIDGLTYSNITMSGILLYPFFLTSFYPNPSSLPPTADDWVTPTATTPYWSNITLRNITASTAASGAKSPGIMWAASEAPMTNIMLDNVSVTGPAGKSFEFHHARGVTITCTCRVDGSQPPINVGAFDANVYYPACGTATRTPSIVPSSTVSPVNTSTRTVTPSKTATLTLTLTSNLTFTSTVTPSRTITSTIAQSPSSSATQTRTASPTFTRTGTPTATFTGTSTRTATPAAPTATFTGTVTRTASATATSTSSVQVTVTSSVSPINTFTRTPSATASVSPMNTFTRTPSATASVSPMNTFTRTPTPLAPTATFTGTSIRTSTPIAPTVTYTATATTTPIAPTVTFTGTVTRTVTPVPPTATRTVTGTIAQSPSETASPDIIATATSTSTSSATASVSPSVTNTMTWTSSVQPTSTSSVQPAKTTTAVPTATTTVISTGIDSPTPTVTSTPNPVFTPTFTYTTAPAPAVFAMEALVFPNPYTPESGDLKIKFSSTRPVEGLNLSIYTSSFRRVFFETGIAPAAVISVQQRKLDRFASGTYYLIVRAEAGQGVRASSQPQEVIILR